MAKQKNNTLDDLTISNIMQREEGRAFIWNYLTYCGVFSNTFNENPIKHAHSAGKRDAGLYLDSQIKSLSPDGYIKMIGEKIDG